MKLSLTGNIGSPCECHIDCQAENAECSVETDTCECQGDFFETVDMTCSPSKSHLHHHNHH